MLTRERQWSHRQSRKLVIESVELHAIDVAVLKLLLLKTLRKLLLLLLSKLLCLQLLLELLLRCPSSCCVFPDYGLNARSRQAS